MPAAFSGLEDECLESEDVFTPEPDLRDKDLLGFLGGSFGVVLSGVLVAEADGDGDCLLVIFRTVTGDLSSSKLVMMMDWTEDTDLSGEAGSMSWLILRTNGAFLWRLMMASACEDEDRAESLLSSSVERAEAAVLSVDTADTEAGCWLATWEGEATLVTSDRVRPQCEAAGPRNLGS